MSAAMAANRWRNEDVGWAVPTDHVLRWAEPTLQLRPSSWMFALRTPLAAGNVIVQDVNLELLRGDDLLDQIADRKKSNQSALFEHGQVATPIFRHQPHRVVD